jgi:hypothetical protein
MEEMARGTSCSATRYVRDLLSRSIVLCILSCTHAQSTTADALDGLADWLQWDVQPTIKRINESLQKRGYLTWFDLEHMKGSTADCMAGAVDGAEVMLYAVSLAYKESANCRMEANYGLQQEVDQIPLMVEKGYKPKGWLGLIIGTRMYYSFCAADIPDEATFQERMDAICREIGDRARAGAVAHKPRLSEAVPPARAAAPAPAPTLAPATPAARSSSSSSSSAVAAAAADRAFTPSVAVQSSPSTALALRRGDNVGSASEVHSGVTIGEIAALIEQQQDRVIGLLAAQREEMRVRTASEVISEAQLATLQSRLQALRDAQLLTEDEVYTVEDAVADCVELMPATASTVPAVDNTVRMIALSERITGDGSFARQLRRKFIR